jgi:hypothetical protein
MVRKYRLLRRRDDGSADYSSTSDEGSELLTVYPDGRKFRHSILGVNLAKAWAGTGTPVQKPLNALNGLSADEDPLQDIPAPVQEPELSVMEPEPARTPMLELEPVAEPAPPAEPVDERLDRDAKTLSRSVWLSNGQRRHHLLHGLRHDRQQELIDYAPGQVWVTLGDDDVVAPGPNRPVDVMPEREPLSARERRARSGPADPLW